MSATELNAPDSETKEHFKLEPGEKFPLNEVYYYSYSIAMRVVDQNSTAIKEDAN